MNQLSPPLIRDTRITVGVTRNLTWVFFSVALLFASGAFVVELSGADLSAPWQPDKGSLLSQFILGSFYTIAAIVFFKSGHALRILPRAWPILLLPFLALVSSAWSSDPGLTFRRGSALFGTVLFGLSLGSVFDSRDCLRLLIRSLTASMLLSILFVVVFPRYGVHQAFDASQAEHVGKWRGIYPHRNVLGGYVAGPTFAFLMIYGRYAFRNLLLRIAAIAATLMCLTGAASGTGFVEAVAITLLGLLLTHIGTQEVRTRVFLISVLLLGGGFLALFADELWSLILWLLGKQPDLTGRTEYWYYITQLIGDESLFGRGYYSGFLSIAAEIADISNLDFGSAHNGYLDLFVYFGYFGLIIGLSVLAWLLLRGLRAVLTTPPSLAAVRTFPFCVAAFACAHSVVESSIVAPNSLVTVLLGIAAGMLARFDTIKGDHLQLG
jgi:exopolysaccharide production protein ExoQ